MSSFIHKIDLQIATSCSIPLAKNILKSWAYLALIQQKTATELTLRLVDEKEIRQLNYQYRKQDKATNVLAFPSNLPHFIILKKNLLGDVIICPDIIRAEAVLYNKTFSAHFAHIIIHGVLHLLGYDHIEEHEALVMNAKEVELLTSLGFANPFQTRNIKIEQRG